MCDIALDSQLGKNYISAVLQKIKNLPPGLSKEKPSKSSLTCSVNPKYIAQSPRFERAYSNQHILKLSSSFRNRRALYILS